MGKKSNRKWKIRQATAEGLARDRMMIKAHGADPKKFDEQLGRFNRRPILKLKTASEVQRDSRNA